MTTLNMNDSCLVSLAQIREFLKVARDIQFSTNSRKEKYAWINEILNRFRYFRLKKRKDKTAIKDYLIKMTGYSKVQMTRLLSQKRRIGTIETASNFGRKNGFTTTYTPADIALLTVVDNAHNRLSGPATKKILIREHEIFKDARFEQLKNISVSHIYNLRETRQYQSHSTIFNPTPTVKRNIGERRKPNPEGKPGFLRVDSVHQGDLHLGFGQYLKGVYHINLVDEVTQWEIIVCVHGISERFLLPALKAALVQFPFTILSFHSDNGSEYINKLVAKLLQGLLIDQTKSRSRQTNDNALVESKNGAVIRKWMGYSHIPGENARQIDNFYHQYFNVYLNFHRPCGFATVTTDAKGKQKKKYDIYLTPYEKFKSLENPTQYLAQRTTIEALDELAYEYSDTGFAQLVQEAKSKLLKNINS